MTPRSCLRCGAALRVVLEPSREPGDVNIATARSGVRITRRTWCDHCLGRRSAELAVEQANRRLEIGLTARIQANPLLAALHDLRVQCDRQLTRALDERLPVQRALLGDAMRRAARELATMRGASQ